MDCTVVHLDLLFNIINNTAKELPKYWRSRESVVRRDVKRTGASFCCCCRSCSSHGTGSSDREASFLVRVKMALGCCCIAWKSWRSCRILEFYSCCQSCSDGAGPVGMVGSFCSNMFIFEVLIFCRSWFGITWSFDARLIVVLGAWIWKPWKLELAIQGGWEIDQHLTKGGCWNLILLLLDVVIFPDERESSECIQLWRAKQAEHFLVRSLCAVFIQ